MERCNEIGPMGFVCTQEKGHEGNHCGSKELDPIILTNKGESAVKEMDERYRKYCNDRGIDYHVWNPELWLEANREYQLEVLDGCN